MAKHICIARYRNTKKKKTVLGAYISKNKSEFILQPKTEQEFIEEDKIESLQKKALRRAIEKLSKRYKLIIDCIIKEGIEKPRDLMKRLDLKNTREATWLKHESIKQLKIKTAIEFEYLSRLK